MTAKRRWARSRSATRSRRICSDVDLSITTVVDVDAGCSPNAFVQLQRNQIREFAAEPQTTRWLLCQLQRSLGGRREILRVGTPIQMLTSLGMDYAQGYEVGCCLRG